MSAAYVCLRCSRRAAAGGQLLRNGTRGAVAAAAASAVRRSTPLGARPQSTSTSAADPLTSRALEEAEGQDMDEFGVLNGSSASTHSRPSAHRARAVNTSSRPKHRAIPPWQAHQIQDLITPERSPLEIWHRTMALHAFSAPALPESLEIGLRRSPETRKAFRLFVRTALHDPHLDFPSLQTVMRRFLDRGLFRYQMLADVLQEARPTLAKAVFGENSAQEVETARALELLQHIMVAYRLTLGVSTARMLLAGQKEAAGWDGLPKPEEVQRFRKEGETYVAMFSGLFSGRLDVRLEQQVASDSAWVFVCMEELKRRESIPEELQEEWKPWIDLMWRLLSQTKSSARSQIRNILISTNNQASEATLRTAVDSWHQSQVEASQTPKDYPDYPIARQLNIKRTGSTFEGSATAKLWNKHIHRAVKQGGERQLLTRWVEFKELSKTWENEEDVSAVVGEFLWGFARLQLRDMTVGVWRFLQDEGLTPTTTHWTAMFEAAKRTGDRDSVPQIWAAMINSGFLPPNPLWTTYISTLLRVRDWQTALLAVQSMGEQWRRVAVQVGERDTPLSEEFRPSMIPINAAVSGLIDMDKPGPVRALLKSAEQHGLVPIIETYNILLRSAVQRKDHAGIRAIFAEMKAAEVEPDVITFTLYIDGLVKDPASPFNTGTAEEAQAAITTLFADITGIGLQPSPVTYATLLYNLLSGASPNLPAAQAVLQQMDDHGVQHSSHAYTILARHYFERDPPDLEAVERLRARIDAEGTELDLRFYDGLVHGYALAGERDRMLSVLRRIPNVSQLRLWTLNDALALCIRDADKDSARTLLQQTVTKLRAPGMSKGERAEVPRWRDLVAKLKRDGVIDREPKPVMFRKVDAWKE